MKTHLDLFSGIGGFAIAAQSCGYTTIGFCEKEPYAQQILKERFGAVLADAEKLQRDGGEHHAGSNRQKRGQISESGNGSCPRLHSDIFTLNGTDYAGVELLTGGFPCQPFSVAGKRRGAADDRALWPEMLRVIAEAMPNWLIGENVAGIITMELDNILSDLEGIGYSAWPLVIPACAVDAKHRRDRVWIVANSGHLRGRGRTEPTESGLATPRDAGEIMADAKRKGLERLNFEILNQCNSERGANDSRQGCSYVADADGQRGCVRDARWENASHARQSHCTWKDEGEWFTESRVGRVANGIPNRAHRLRGLGNAIVPQVAQEIIRAIGIIQPSPPCGERHSQSASVCSRAEGTNL